jgi:hypothetical protein
MKDRARLAEQIKREFEIEQKEQRKAVNPEDIPSSYEAITPEWLTHALCKDKPGAKVLGLRLDAPDDGNANRRRIFITYNAQGDLAGLPASVFCKASQKLANRLVMANCDLLQIEIDFYTRYRPKLNIEAPACFLATYSRHTYNSIIVLDDLVRKGAEFCDITTDMTLQRVQSQLRLLARMHGQYYDKPEVRNSDIFTFEGIWNSNDRWFGIKDCCTNGFRMAESVIPARLFRRHQEIWPATMKAVEMHGRFPRTFTHNDVHLRNWYIAADGELGSCDFQSFARGHWARDVVYTISTALTVENRRLWEKDLLRYYLDKLRAEGGAAVSFDDAWKFYRQHLFTSLGFWTLTLAPSSGQSDVPAPLFQPSAAILEFIHRMSTAIDDLDALSSFK